MPKEGHTTCGGKGLEATCGPALWEGVNRWVDTRIVWLLEAKDYIYM